MSKFLKVSGKKCKNEQTVFGQATSDVKCLICGEPILTTTGGKAKIVAKIVEPL